MSDLAHLLFQRRTIAIFDSEQISNDGSAENLVLETPFFDASVSQEILCSFDHYFVGGNGAAASIEVFDGDETEPVWGTNDYVAYFRILRQKGIGRIPKIRLRLRLHNSILIVSCMDPQAFFRGTIIPSMCLLSDKLY